MILFIHKSYAETILIFQRLADMDKQLREDTFTSESLTDGNGAIEENLVCRYFTTFQNYIVRSLRRTVFCQPSRYRHLHAGDHRIIAGLRFTDKHTAASLEVFQHGFIHTALSKPLFCALLRREVFPFRFAQHL